MKSVRIERHASVLLLATLLAGAAAGADARAPSAVVVERTGPARVTVRWVSDGPVDVYLATRPHDSPAEARPVSRSDRDGEHQVDVAPGDRPYFLLRAHGGREFVRAAERALPLERGSNFRDLGGYPADGGRRVRWGLIYRSGGTPLLSGDDLQQVRGLGLREMFDLRSSEERVLAPTRIEGVRYAAIGYSMASMNGGALDPESMRDVGRLYRNFPRVFAPHLREIFGTLQRDGAPLAYNCSAGQDRTGFATAMILSALGVPREVIYEDYHLSTRLRRPEYEMPRIDAAAMAGNPVALFFAKYQADPAAATPTPLYAPDEKPLLWFAFDEIESRWGSVERYLDQEIGLGPRDLARLRARYLE